MEEHDPRREMSERETVRPPERRFELRRRRRLHYPGFVTRLTLYDQATGSRLDFNDRQLAEQLAEALEAGDVAGGPGPRLRHYAAVRSPRRRKTWLRRTDSSVESYLVGVSGDAALAERAVEILNRLDPAQLKPPRPIKIGWW